MKIVIVGCGKIGTTLTARLRKENHDISVIDVNGKLVDSVMDQYDVYGVHGTGINCDVLRKAGVEGADLVVAAAPTDEINLLSCTIAGKMGAKHCIARVRDPNLTGQMQFMRDALGITDTVNPEYDAAAEISRIVRMPSAIKVDAFAKGRIDLAEYKIEEGSLLDGVALFKLPAVYKESRLLICAVTRGEEVLIPAGDFILKAGDRIHMTASPADLSMFFKKQGSSSARVRNALIVGGGRITYHLTRMLLDAGVAVKIVEIDGDRCASLSSAFPKARIINGDGTDQDILISEGLDRADAFVSLTGMDEENIIISMYARSRANAKVITKINRASLNRLVTEFKLDSVVSPRELTANSIIQYVRAVENVGSSGIVTYRALVDGKVEALEFIAGDRSRLLNIPLKDLKLKPNVLIGGIIRENKVIIPTGSDTVVINDRVVIVTTNRFFRDLDEILA